MNRFTCVTGCPKYLRGCWWKPVGFCCIRAVDLLTNLSRGDCFLSECFSSSLFGMCSSSRLCMICNRQCNANLQDNRADIGASIQQLTMP